jgi:hypothetical protein
MKRPKSLEQIPPILTKSNWDKQKGIIAKIGVGKTGIGEQMEVVKKTFTVVNWHLLDAYTLFPEAKPAKPESVKASFKVAEAEYKNHVIPLENALEELQKRALKAHGIFLGKTLIPKSVTAQVQQIADQAGHMHGDLKKSVQPQMVVHEFEAVLKEKMSA